MHDFVMTIGPQNLAMSEPLLLKLTMDGNKVAKVDMKMGYMHKGLEKLLEGNNPEQAMYIASRSCGICSFSHERAYLRAMEKLANVVPNDDVAYNRMVIFELERISSHLLWAGQMMNESGKPELLQEFWKEREKILSLNELIAGARVHKNIGKIGSMRDMITDDQKKAMRGVLDSVDEQVKKHSEDIMSDDSITEKLRGLGVVSKKEAEENALIGPAARASGVMNDIRKIDPYDMYSKIKFQSFIGKRGDCLERVKIRLNEMEESIKIIGQCLENAGTEKSAEIKSVPDGEAYSRVEAPRGELFYFIKTKNNLIERTKIRTPTLAYIQYLDEMLVGNDVKDVPLIVASLDPCFSCLERVMIAKEGATRSFNEKEFRDSYCR